MRARTRWLLCAGCALILGLEAPAALAVLRGPQPARGPLSVPARPAVEAEARAPEASARPDPRGPRGPRGPSGATLDRGCLTLPRG